MIKKTRRCQRHVVTAFAGAFCASAALAQSPDPVYIKDNSRLQGPAVDVSGFDLGVDDYQEKDYAWGDLNLNGWVDLVVMRKQPFTSTGKRQNQLYMNENGVLVDRTAEYASAVALDQITTAPGWPSHTDYPDDQGFLTPTNDRMAALADFTGNGHLDIATAVTLSDNDPKHIGHPRIYINLGSPAGAWLGFRFENERIPAMLSKEGIAGHNPRFCAVDAGDLTGNGWPDLYFSDYDNAPGVPVVPAGGDMDDKLLINQGDANPGYFADETTSRFAGVVSIPGSSNQPFPVSAFGPSNVIADINGNGHNDIVKITTLHTPVYVGVAYNMDGDGVFKDGSFYQVPITAQPYFVSAADLNNNGRLDLVLTDDFVDRYLLNLSTSENGTVSWSPMTQFPGPSGFASNSTVVALRYHEGDPNAWNDVIIADVSVDIPGCNRITQIYRNNENGTNVTFTNISDEVMPASERQGTFHVGAFDITGNGWTDLVWGRCTGTTVWVMEPPELLPDLAFTYPNGLPALIAPGSETTILVELSPMHGALDPTSVKLYAAINGGSFTTHSMSVTDGGAFVGTIPAAQCNDVITWYISAEVEGAAFSDPSDAPADGFEALVMLDILTLVSEDFDGPGAGVEWSVEGSPTMGQWVLAEPLGALHGGQVAAPFGASVGTNAFVTCAGCIGSNCVTQSCKVLDGPTHLISPAFDVEDDDALITYERFAYSRTGVDYLRTYVSNDNGATWTFVHETNGTSGVWETSSFFVSDYVMPSAQVRVRFSIDDDSETSTANGGIDNFNVEVFDCGSGPRMCPADLTGTGMVNVFDLLELLAAWGPTPGSGHPADLNGDGVINVFDLLDLLAQWGPCP